LIKQIRTSNVFLKIDVFIIFYNHCGGQSVQTCIYVTMSLPTDNGQPKVSTAHVVH